MEAVKGTEGKPRPEPVTEYISSMQTAKGRDRSRSEDINLNDVDDLLYHSGILLIEFEL